MRNKVISNYLVLLVLAVVSFAGCKKDELGTSSAEQEQVAINLTLPNVTFTRNGGVVTDETVSRVRVFAFDRNDRGRCKLNSYVKTPTDPFWFHLSTGSYDFYFVINEPLAAGEEATGNATLNAVRSYADLANFHVATSDLVAADGHYVMLGSQSDVRVEANYNRPSQDGHPGEYEYHAMVSYTPAVGAAVVRGDNLNIVVERLAVKVNLKLLYNGGVNHGQIVSSSDVSNDGVKITSLPTFVAILPGVVSVSTATTEVLLQPAMLDNPSPATGTYEGYTGIVPSSYFTPISDRSRAAMLNVTMEGGAQLTHKMAIGHRIDTSTFDYTLHRNTTYHITGKLSGVLVLTITTYNWADQGSVELPI